MPILMKNVRVQGIFVGSREMFEAMNRAIALHNSARRRSRLSVRRIRAAEAPGKRSDHSVRLSSLSEGARLGRRDSRKRRAQSVCHGSLANSRSTRKPWHAPHCLRASSGTPANHVRRGRRRSGFDICPDADNLSRLLPIIGQAAGFQHLGQLVLGVFGQGTGSDGGQGVLDGILDSMQIDSIVLDYGIGSAGVTVALLSDACPD